MTQYKVTVIGGESSMNCCQPVAKPLSQAEVESHLNSMGSEGWKLNFVQVSPGSQQIGTMYYYIWEK
jgi:hypothetical protein|tara:strand:- start:849 stop:1049 length:201 start_codon:yes stop_codon:yes gene_type:complete